MLKEPTPRLTLCLAMDLMGSTTAGLKLSTRKLDRFNLAVIDQLGPYLELVQLEHALVKFTGDGWLVMSDEQNDAPKLCCLAMIMSHRFQWDIMAATGFHRSSIPAMRLAICWGRDLSVTLPSGGRDFVGNSVRHAVRACQLCEDNEVLVDETVRTWISHDFHSARCDLESRIAERPGIKMEEELVLHTLRELKVESVEDVEAPIYFVNTLFVIGRPDEADLLAKGISVSLATEASSSSADQSELLERFNELLNSTVDHETARQLVLDLKRSGLKPNIGTYNALIEKSEGFSSAQGWVDALVEEGLSPNLETLNLCLAKTDRNSEASGFLDRLLDSGVIPNRLTLRMMLQMPQPYSVAEACARRLWTIGVEPSPDAYELLIDRSEEFEVGKRWLEAIMAKGWEPTEHAFIETFSKGVLGLSADELLNWYLGLPKHPAHPIKRAIAEYRKAGRIHDALRLALDYPHTDTALKAIRQYPDQALKYFRSVVENNPDHPNGAYALGTALVGLGRHDEATPWLRKAFELAAPGPRKDELARYLPLFEHVLADV